MPRAIVLASCEAGKYVDVAKQVAKIPGVEEAFPTFGRWDVVARVAGKDLVELSKVALRINAQKGVKATETLVEAVV